MPRCLMMAEAIRAPAASALALKIVLLLCDFPTPGRWPSCFSPVYSKLLLPVIHRRATTLVEDMMRAAAATIVDGANYNLLFAVKDLAISWPTRLCFVYWHASGGEASVSLSARHRTLRGNTV